MQAGEETSRVTEMYAAVTVLYIISAMVINRFMAWVEKKVRVPGFVVAGGTGGH
jgi:glutamate/aspartate transport system permease protein